MKSSTFFVSLGLLIEVIGAFKQGKDSSFFYSSSANAFNYSKITDIVIFWRFVYSDVSTNYTTMDYSGQNMALRKNRGLYLTEDIHSMKLWSYAYSGAVIDTEVINALTSEYSMTEQYELFFNNMSAGKQFEHEWNGDSTLFAIWFGINDLIDKTINGEKIIVDTISEEIDTKDIISMFKNGSRHSRGNLPNLILNLKSFVEDLKDRYSDTNIFIYNSYDEFRYIFENHSNYNLTEINTFSMNEYEIHFNAIFIFDIEANVIFVLYFQYVFFAYCTLYINKLEIKNNEKYYQNIFELQTSSNPKFI
ncbi:hypothetical protein H8356DRAFT_1072546 [Neocallimastix lanati (nom. inval.)]|nr:hypothetical protein H8356DRAFT_1072546 [Neocallimastix sp. JGI-2020a]